MMQITLLHAICMKIHVSTPQVLLLIFVQLWSTTLYLPLLLFVMDSTNIFDICHLASMKWWIALYAYRKKMAILSVKRSVHE